ncbi:MAG: glycoside hydrolase family 26 protein [Frankia sp.]
MRSLRTRRLLPATALIVAAAVGFVGWTIAPTGASNGEGNATVAASRDSMNGGSSTGDGGAGLGGQIGLAAKNAKGAGQSTASASPAPNSAGSSSGGTRPTVARAATSGPFPSGINAGTLTKANAWAAFRGRPADVVVVYTERGSWNDIIHSWVGADREHFAGFAGTWVLSVPLFPDSGPQQGNLPSCAAGAYDAEWRAFGATLVARGRGSSFVRLGWEFNGSWFAWSATDPTAWMSCFRHASAAIRATDPSVRIDWNLNAHNSAGIDAFNLYPGDAYVDVIGVDSYDEYPPSDDALSFSSQCHGTDGLCVAIAFARAHHKLFSVPEWGVVATSDTAAGSNGGGDNLVYIQQMYQTFMQNRDILAYESYFSDSTPGNVHSSLLDPDENPASAREYAQLW